MKMMLRSLLPFIPVLLFSCGSDLDMDQVSRDLSNPTEQPTSALDSDNDGIPDEEDACPGTPNTESADANGCAPSQKDSDNDGVNDALDTCANTPEGEQTNADGCGPSQLDTDNDGINDLNDECPESPAGENADASGCTPSQKDDDNDGVSNALDTCPDTPENQPVNEQGCHTPAIGEYFQGGYVFYIFQPEDDRYVEGEVHGLIAAPEDLATSDLPWAPEGAAPESPIFNGNTSLNGEINTQYIVDTYGEGTYAAKACYDLELNGYDDWYLGSDFEVYYLCQNLYHAGESPNAYGFGFDHYWTSNELGVLAKKNALEKVMILNFEGIGGSTIYFDICEISEGFRKNSKILATRAIRDF
ncbi:thrombospondin type 3 repeat-containing protein [Robertkochia marina]|nr:thrombospondin type 3 repeat-containing protein [Robertkochia marina]